MVLLAVALLLFFFRHTRAHAHNQFHSHVSTPVASQDAKRKASRPELGGGGGDAKRARLSAESAEPPAADIRQGFADYGYQADNDDDVICIDMGNSASLDEDAQIQAAISASLRDQKPSAGASGPLQPAAARDAPAARAASPVRAPALAPDASGAPPGGAAWQERDPPPGPPPPVATKRPAPRAVFTRKGGKTAEELKVRDACRAVSPSWGGAAAAPVAAPPEADAEAEAEVAERGVPSSGAGGPGRGHGHAAAEESGLGTGALLGGASDYDFDFTCENEDGGGGEPLRLGLGRSPEDQQSGGPADSTTPENEEGAQAQREATPPTARTPPAPCLPHAASARSPSSSFFPQLRPFPQLFLLALLLSRFPSPPPFSLHILTISPNPTKPNRMHTRVSSQWLRASTLQALMPRPRWRRRWTWRLLGRVGRSLFRSGTRGSLWVWRTTPGALWELGNSEGRKTGAERGIVGFVWKCIPGEEVARGRRRCSCRMPE